MSRIVGIEFDGERLYGALLHASYRKLELIALAKELVSDHESIEVALARVVAGLGSEPFDHLATSVDGRKVFSHHLEIPGAAKKRLDELLGFELEAGLPLDIEDVVFDRQILPDDQMQAGQVKVLTLAARFNDVNGLLTLFESALKRQPEVVSGGAMTLEHLARIYPSLQQATTVAVLNINHENMDICVLRNGVTHFGRTLSVRLSDFPEVGPRALALMRQSFSSIASTLSEPVSEVFVVGPGVRMAKIDEYLSEHLGISVSILSEPQGLEIGAPELAERVPEFAKAIASALLSQGGKGFDLRQGPLAFQRGYGYLKQRIPLLAGLFAAVLLSFLFSTWADAQALKADHLALVSSLEEATKATFGEKIADADEAETALAQAKSAKPEDPMPYLDGFGVAVVLSEVIPVDIVHDIEDLEVSKGKVKLRALVSSAEEAQTVVKALGEHRCINEAKVNKISQVVSSRVERKRYLLEATVECPEDTKPKKSGASR